MALLSLMDLKRRPIEVRPLGLVFTVGEVSLALPARSGWVMSVSVRAN